MTLTLEEKAVLIDAYEPIVYYHPQEKFPPINPATFMRASAMWCNKPPRHRLESWGNCAHDPEETAFPRAPLIPLGQLKLTPEEHGIDGGIWIGNQPTGDGFYRYLADNEEAGLFLQRGDWTGRGPNDVQPPDPGDLMFAGIAAEPSPFGANMVHVWADVRDQDTAPLVPQSTTAALPPGIANVMQIHYPRGYWMITYHYFYAYHEERLIDCEIDSEWARARIDEEPMHVLPHGTYEGEWQAVTVLVPNPGAPPQQGSPTHVPPGPESPLNIDPEDMPQPDQIGLSRRARGVLANFVGRTAQPEDLTFMVTRSFVGTDVARIDRHAKVFVARGTHNMYFEAGQQTAPKLDNALPYQVDIPDICEDYDSVIDEWQGWIQTIDQTRFRFRKGREVSVGLNKIFMGIAVGGIIGGLFGFVTSVHEGVAQSRRTFDPPEWPQGPEEVDDEGPPVTPPEGQPNFGLVLAPAALVEAVEADLNVLGQTAQQVSSPEGEAAERVVIRDLQRQPWWQPDGQSPVGYEGRWGIVTERDPFDRRSGSKIPAFEAVFLNSLFLE
ncbi:hypothetical protein [Halomonas rhizosphaerae]|uniref:DUF4178 domain-containing protein n=1 Tax=Halomonas rhizosphaerae TaxID=3043296 RepID=A0ABT6UZ09_9GAMM|nr:hypothetical protein [Halomonas rhizosphaerae]MDI5891223.1 hypothetical protein [Halomonas rhizosphaerae]